MYFIIIYIYVLNYFIFIYLGNLIFNSNERSTNQINDPFRPDGLNTRALNNYGAPSKLSAKPRKRNPLHPLNTIPPSNDMSSIPCTIYYYNIFGKK